MPNTNDEIGATGLVEFSGRIQADFLREMRGLEGYKRINEMRLNSPVIGALLLALRQPIMAMEWTPHSTDENDARLELLQAAIDNMSYSWYDHVDEALLFLPFGYYPFEIVYERVGNNMLWHKFAPRGQDTVTRWKFAANGAIEGYYQRVNFVDERFIPMERTLLYRVNVERNNPEGRSILRTAWISYYYVKHISQAEAIGLERGLDGFPVIGLPEGASTDENDVNSDASKAAEFVRNVRNDEQAGMVMPFGWTFELFAPGAQSRLDADKVIRRYESRMLMSALAQFLNLGQENVGSMALSKDQTDFFAMSLNSVADIISETVTKYAIPRLMKLNGYDSKGLSIEHSPAVQEDITQISAFVSQIGQYLNWSAEDEVWLRQAARLPERNVNDIQADRDANKLPMINTSGQGNVLPTDAIEKPADTAMNGAQVASLVQIITLVSLNQLPPDTAIKLIGEAFPSMDKTVITQMVRSAMSFNPDKTNAAPGKFTSLFSASAPDEAKRRRIEKDLQKKLLASFEKSKKRILKQAKEYRA